MTAVASPQPERLPQKPEQDNLLAYVNSQFRQPAQSTRHAQSSTSLRQELPSNRGQERRRAELSVTRSSSKNSVNAKSDRAQMGQRPPSAEQSEDNQEIAANRPNAQLVRANTDCAPRRHSPVIKRDLPEENWELRHGWEDQYNSTEYLGLLSSVSLSLLPMTLLNRNTPRDQANHISSGFLHVLH
jgi:hypothetical protein